MAGLVLALLVGVRKGFGKEVMRPHNIPFTMLGAGLLWFGWFGFNVGSIVPTATQGVAGKQSAFFDNSVQFATNFVGETGMVWINTCVATAAAMLGWLLVEKIRDGHATSLGAASGVVAGLVAITPACGSLSPVGSIILGLVAGGLCALAVGLKYRFGYDDSLDVVGVHLVGGLVGTILIGFLSTTTGLFYGHDAKQLVIQTLVALAAVLWSGVFTLVIGLALKYAMGWRIHEEAEVEGIDFTEHGETAYDFAARPGAARLSPGSASPAPSPRNENEGAMA
jgi:Amt family ammonium transporter